MKAEELIQRLIDHHDAKGEDIPLYSGVYHNMTVEVAQVYATLSQAAAIRESRLSLGGGPG